MTPDPCARCGACCDYPEPWSIVDLTLQDMERIPLEMTVPSFGNWRKMARTGNRCVALVGTVGVDARCSIYDIRPTVCRDYDPAARAAECEMCRAASGSIRAKRNSLRFDHHILTTAFDHPGNGI